MQGTIRKRTWQTKTGKSRSAYYLDVKLPNGKRTRQKLKATSLRSATAEVRKLQSESVQQKNVIQKLQSKEGEQVHQPLVSVTSKTFIPAEQSVIYPQSLKKLRFRTAFRKLADSIEYRIRPSTMHGYRNASKLFSRMFGNPFLHEITPRMIIEFRERLQTRRRKLSPASINCYVHNLRTIFNYFIKQHWLYENPARGIRQLSVPRRKRVLTLPELERLLGHLNSEESHILYLFTMMVLLTGARLSEILALRYSDWEPEMNILRIPAIKTDSKTVPVTGLMKQILEELLVTKGSEERLFPHQAGKYSHEMRRIMRLLNIEIAQPIHGLRHTFATMNLIDGIPLRSVSKALGHSSQAVTEMFYAHDNLVAGGAAYENVERRLRGMCGGIVEDEQDDLEFDD
jgi:integrase